MTNCALCLCPAPLCESHLIPAFVYRFLKSRRQELVVIAEDKSFTTSKELKKPLLCEKCEGRFGSREQYVSSLYLQSDGAYPLQTQTRQCSKICDIEYGSAHRGSEWVDLDKEQICYFALSLFWRASITEWVYEKRNLKRSKLGEKYDEIFRLYLLGKEAFPLQARVFVLVSKREEPTLSLHIPIGWRECGYHVHRVTIPGLQILLKLGEVHKEGVESCCFFSSKESVIFLSDWGDELLASDATNLLKSSQLSRRLSKELLI